MTVAMCLILNGKTPPEKWRYKDKIKNMHGKTFEQMLDEQNYLYQEGEFKPNVKL